MTTTSKCICAAANATEAVEFCEVCRSYNDFCVACTPEPACTCVYVREDVTDAGGCERCDPESHYNFIVRTAERKAAAARKPAGPAHPVFDPVLNYLRGRVA